MLNIKMLLTDGYGGIGGIAKFNRDFLQALNCCPDVKRVHALPRLIQNPIREAIPRAVVYEQKSARGKAAFMARVGAHALRRDGTNFVICGHINLLPAAVPLARLHRARLALIIHGVDAWAPTSRPLVNRLVRRIDEFISVSQHSAELFARWSKVSLNRGYILPNCVDLDLFKPQPPDIDLVRRYGLEGCRVILTVGRLSSLEQCKGFDEIIELMPRLLRRYANLKYLIVGDGDDRPRLEAKAESLAPGKVIFAGHVPESEKIAHYNLADAYVMPSRGEGFGIVLIEAAACGVPIVGSSADGSREALLDGKLGRLVDPMDQGMLFDAICAALEESDRRAAGGIRTRPDLSTYGVDKFNSRVADWCRRQTHMLEAA